MGRLLVVILPATMLLARPLPVAAQAAGDIETQVRKICQGFRRQLERADDVDDATVSTRLDSLGAAARPVLVQMLLVHKPAGAVANARFRTVLLGVVAKAEDSELADYAVKLAAGYRQLPSLTRRSLLRQPSLPPLPRIFRGGGKAMRRFIEVLNQQRTLVGKYNRALDAECKKLSAENAVIEQCQKLFLDLLTRSICDKTADDWLKALRDRIRQDDRAVLWMISRLEQALADIPVDRLSAKGGAAALYQGLAGIAGDGTKLHTFYTWSRMEAHRRARNVPDLRTGRPRSVDGFSHRFIHRQDMVPAAHLEPLLAALRVRGKGPIGPKSGAP